MEPYRITVQGVPFACECGNDLFKADESLSEDGVSVQSIYCTVCGEEYVGLKG